MEKSKEKHHRSEEIALKGHLEQQIQVKCIIASFLEELFAINMLSLLAEVHNRLTIQFSFPFSSTGNRESSLMPPKPHVEVTGLSKTSSKTHPPQCLL